VRRCIAMTMFFVLIEHQKGARSIVPLSICTNLSARGYLPKNST
jgi:hypothetical protein